MIVNSLPTMIYDYYYYYSIISNSEGRREKILHDTTCRENRLTSLTACTSEVICLCDLSYLNKVEEYLYLYLLENSLIDYDLIESISNYNYNIILPK